MKSKPPAPPGAVSLLRRLRLGPGMLLAIALSVFLWVRLPPGLPNSGQRPVVEHLPAPASGPVATPDVSELLRHAKALALTSRQQNRIRRLANEWEPESTERRWTMAVAADQFRDSMREAERRGASDFGEIQRNAAPVSALTSQWLHRKGYFWHRGLAELTPEQRQRAERMLPRSSHPPKEDGAEK